MASLEPPPRYITLTEAAEKPPGNPFCVIGICVDYLPPARSRGSDYTIRFTLADATWFTDKGMNFRFFNQNQESLPAIQNTGDIVVLKNVATRVFAGSSFGLSNHSTIWYVLSGSSVVDSTCPKGTDIKYVRTPSKYMHEPLTVPELQYAKALARITDPGTFKMPPKATSLQVETIMLENGGTPPARKDKRRLLRDLELNRDNSGKFSDGKPAFADLFGEVRRMYTGDFSCADIYLTDYTSNSKFYNYEHSSTAREGDEYGYVTNAKSWQGPWGKMTIKVFLWDAHGMFVKTYVKERMYVLIKNCHIRFDPNGSKLEAVCRGDRDDASKVNVTIFDATTHANDQRFKELLRRRTEYEKLANKQGLPFGLSYGTKTAKRHADAQPKPAKVSKSKRKKLKKIALQQAASDSDHKSSAPNPNIRCNNVEVPVTPIDKIVDLDILKRKTQTGKEYYLPFQNAAYKCNVRVVDYWPEDVALFAVPVQHILVKAASSGGVVDDEYIQRDISIDAARNADINLDIRWEWRFVLIVEDATSNHTGSKPRIPVLITGQHGDCLLKEDACDLENNADILAMLQEKLFIMWGDLQEKKEASLLADGASENQSRSQRAFQCLIHEYGIPTEQSVNESTTKVNYQRLFQMFGTTIM